MVQVGKQTNLCFMMSDTINYKMDYLHTMKKEKTDRHNAYHLEFLFYTY